MKQMALLTSFFGAISFISGVIAENKKVYPFKSIFKAIGAVSGT